MRVHVTVDEAAEIMDRPRDYVLGLLANNRLRAMKDGRIHLHWINQWAKDWLRREKCGVYIIRAEEVRRYKIGFARDVYVRLSDLQTASPVLLTLVGFVRTPNPKREYELHRRFRFSRLHGEWFSETPALLELCDRRPLPHLTQLMMAAEIQNVAA